MTLFTSLGIEPSSFILGLIFGGIAGMILAFGLVLLVDRLMMGEGL